MSPFKLDFILYIEIKAEKAKMNKDYKIAHPEQKTPKANFHTMYVPSST